MHETIATHLELLPALQRAETVYDRSTAQHSARVGTMSALIGEVLGLDSAELGILTWVGVLHDIGKLTVSEEVLHKPGSPFTADEWEQLRHHAIAGEQLMLAFGSQLRPMAAVVRSHHERWDGSGYPDGLDGEDLPSFARIIGVADAYDLLTHAQPYRKDSLAHHAAIELVVHGRGTKFEPGVVDAFAHLDRRGVIATIARSMQHRPSTIAAVNAARRVGVGTTRHRHLRTSVA